MRSCTPKARSIRINEWTTAAGEKRTGLSMAAWRAERPGVGRNKPKRPISKESGMPSGVVGDRGMARQGSDRRASSAYQTQQGYSPQVRYAQSKRGPEFFNDEGR
jgi:hypothetical protein